MKKRNAWFFGLAALFAVVVCYAFRFYPQQQMPVGEPVNIKTIEPKKYHNDCLHPCVRELRDGSFVMVQTPYYGWNNKVENPMVFFSDDIREWGMGRLLVDTPVKGFNSDPNVFVEDSTVCVFWRVFGTPLCDEYGMDEIVVGGDLEGIIRDTIPENIFIWNNWHEGDLTQCPILIKYGDKYLFYAAWYQYGPKREGKGLAIWEGLSLEKPDFKLVDTLKFDTPLVCDKLFQKKVGNWIYYLPVPKRYDLWHFDLFEYEDKLFMVSCAEKDDNIMLSVSTDWKHFQTCWKPLVNNHCSENYTGYRQYYYKPTAIVQNDSLYLFYTANAEDDPDRNQLFLSVKAMKELKF